MTDNTDLRKKRREERLAEKRKSLDKILWKLNDVSYALRREETFLGRSSAYKNLMIALDWMEDQVVEDLNRYERIIENKSAREEMQQLQQALNRERKLREELETKVKEASISGGLFIEYVKGKLGIK